MSGIWMRFQELIRRTRVDRELDEEVALHLQLMEGEFRRRGMTEAEARAAARREFGGVAHTKEAYRDQRGFPSVESFAKDVRYALRGLRRSPGFTAAAVLSLALGIGANTAVFSLFHTLMLRMLPVAHAEQLVAIHRTGGWGVGSVSTPLYREISARADLFTGVLASSRVYKVRITPHPGGREEFTQREYVSGNYFQVLGIQPVIGRLFNGDDNRVPGGHPLAVLGYDLWRNRFGADPAVLGRTVLVDDQPLTVIGVASPGFRGVEVERRTEVWVPFMMSPGPVMSPNTWWLALMARMRPDMPRARALAALDVLMQQHLRTLYGKSPVSTFRDRALSQRLEIRAGSVGLSFLREHFGKPLGVLLALVALVLLAACLNVANLLLAQGAARQKEIAMRLSLGATRARLVRQALTETLLIAVAGSAVGVCLAAWGVRIVAGFLPEQAGNPFSSAPNLAVLGFTIAISLGSALLFGLGPAFRSTAINPIAGLRSGGCDRAGHTALRRVLVVAQVAFSVVLVALAFLFGHSLLAMRSVDLGFRNQSVITFNLDLPRHWKGDFHAAQDRLLIALAATPGIYSVSGAFPGLFAGGSSDSTIRVPGSARTATEPADVDQTYLAPRYFETIGATLQGREFDRNDTAASPKVAVVNEAFVREFLPGETHPESRWLSFDDSKPEGGERTSIVGVVRDIRQDGIQEKIAPRVYVPLTQKELDFPPDVVVRTALPLAAVKAVVQRELPHIGAGIAVTEWATIRQRIDDSIFETRLLATLGGFFGVLALLLAAVGLYGVMSYGMAKRTGEIGIRMALGARGADVVGMVLRDALLLVAAGLTLGFPLAWAAARAVHSLLFGIDAVDPLAFGGTGAVLIAVALAAAFLPARRAASIDPMAALRHE
ncbi:MAG: ADOP family duplicated permease [Bryobacteraceae bacterium]